MSSRQLSHSSMIILADCDCFYVSCERLFNIKARTRPVIVLSNNDGCVVSSSPDAKKFGAKTGVPYFEIKKDFEAAGGMAFSANYTLYADLSNRVMCYLVELAGDYADIEFYSVDEVFIRVKWTCTEAQALTILENSRKKILKELGVPVSFSLSLNKTLAKVGMTEAKKRPGRAIVFVDRRDIDYILNMMPVEDIWGIGKASGAKLRAIGAKTAMNFSKAEDKLVRSLLTITGSRTQMELRGINCIVMKDEIDPKKGICTSRSFLKPVFELEEVERYISDHIMNSSDKLRKSNQVCHQLSVFLCSNPFREGAPQCFLSKTVKLSQGEDSPTVLAKKAIEIIREIFQWGYEFRKCGVTLYDLRPKNERQLSLFEENSEKDEKKTEAIDKINKIFGPRTIKLMSCNKDVPLPDKAIRSKRYTTNLKEILVIDL